MARAKKTNKPSPVKGKAVGRPTLYDQRYASMMDQYFDIEAGLDIEIENAKGDVKFARQAATFPTLAGFACKIGVHRETLLNWANERDEDGELKHPEFFDAYKRAKDHQERILVENGLMGGYQHSFAIFTVKNVLGWRDKSETALTGPEGGPVKTQSLTITDDMSAEEATRIYMEMLQIGKR